VCGAQNAAALDEDALVDVINSVSAVDTVLRSNRHLLYEYSATSVASSNIKFHSLETLNNAEICTLWFPMAKKAPPPPLFAVTPSRTTPFLVSIFASGIDPIGRIPDERHGIMFRHSNLDLSLLLFHRNFANFGVHPRRNSEESSKIVLLTAEVETSERGSTASNFPIFHVNILFSLIS